MRNLSKSCQTCDYWAILKKTLNRNCDYCDYCTTKYPLKALPTFQSLSETEQHGNANSHYGTRNLPINVIPWNRFHRPREPYGGLLKKAKEDKDSEKSAIGCFIWKLNVPDVTIISRRNQMLIFTWILRKWIHIFIKSADYNCQTVEFGSQENRLPFPTSAKDFEHIILSRMLHW